MLEAGLNRHRTGNQLKRKVFFFFFKKKAHKPSQPEFSMETVKTPRSPQATIALSAVAFQKHALESLLSPNSSLATKRKRPRFIWGEGDERESSL